MRPWAGSVSDRGRMCCGRLRPTLVRVRTDEVLAGLKRRWTHAGFPSYPVWIPLVMDGSAVAAGVGSVVQRVGEHPLLPVTALVLVALTPWFVDFVGVWVPWWIFAAMVIGGTTTVMVVYPVELDFAVYLLVLMAGHIGATDRLAFSAAATASAGVVLVVLDRMGEFTGSKFWFAALVIGWDVGFMLQHQQRALEEQQRSQSAREQQVMLEERQRIAREVHDVIAHSLSVTMLHLTAARRDLEEDGAAHVEEAVDALRDAERVGRQAMADIRRTVGLLGSPVPGPVAPAPDLADVPALVQEFRDAGVEVSYRSTVGGDALHALPAPVGLGVFRVLQESLANVAKHQPRAAVAVELHRVGDTLQLTVVNDLPRRVDGPAQEPDGLGSGLRGMRERAELLGGTLLAGADGAGWRVQLEVPLDCDSSSGSAASRCLPFGGRRPAEELS